MIKSRISDFFAFARKRHQIYLDRSSGILPPYTDDIALTRFRFTNIYRELDRTTAWFRENVRKIYDNSPEVLLATTLFRGFNRIETGEMIFGKQYNPQSVGHRWIRNEARDDELTEALSDIQNSGLSVVTGAYTIMTPPGLTKSEGVAYYANTFRRRGEWFDHANMISKFAGTAPREASWAHLVTYPGLGSFSAGQIVADLTQTYLHNNSVDRMIWTPLGPGSTRGLHILSDRPRDGRSLSGIPHIDHLMSEMKYLLSLSRSSEHWPNDEDFPSLELSDIQNTLCEYSKYYRIHNEAGKTRSLWDGKSRPVPGRDDYK